MKKLIILLFSILLFVNSQLGFAQVRPDPRGHNFEDERMFEPESAPGEIIVKLKEGYSVSDIAQLNAKYNITSSEDVFPEEPLVEDVLKQLKGKLAGFSAEHESWYWQTDKNSKEYKEYMAKFEADKARLEAQIKEQEELVERLNKRQQRNPDGLNETGDKLKNTFLLKTLQTGSLEQVISEYKQNPAVEYAEPNYIAKTQ